MTEITTEREITTLPRWFKVAAIIALVWNLLGVAAFISHMTMTPDSLAQLPLAEQALYDAVPLWATIAFAIAVFGGALGSLALLLKKDLCYPLFIASFVAIVVQHFHSFFISNAYEVYGPGGTIMPILVVVIALVLVLFSAKGYKNNWFS